MDLSVLIDFARCYAPSEKMPFSVSGISEIARAIMARAQYDVSDCDIPEGFIESLTGLTEFLKRDDVYLSEISRSLETENIVFTLSSSYKTEWVTWVLELSSTNEGELYGSYLRISNSKGDYASFSVGDDKGTSAEFMDDIVTESLLSVNEVNEFHNLLRIKGSADIPLFTGGKLRNADYASRFGSDPEAHVLHVIQKLLTSPGAQIIMGLQTGRTDLVWDAYENDEPTLAHAPVVIKSILTESKNVGTQPSRDVLNKISQWDQGFDYFGSLASLCPLSVNDGIHSESKILNDAEVVSIYLSGANADEVKHTISVLNKKGFNETNISPDVYSAINNALLMARSVTEPAPSQRKTRRI